MPRTFPILTTRREWSLRARFVVALLALVQFIAPTWHVCEMGGASCCPPKTSSAKQHCLAGSTPFAATAAKKDCEECPKPSSQLENTPEPHGENCLAKLLMGMPLQHAAPIALLEFSSHRAPSTPFLRRAAFIGNLPQPPSRAPPVFL